MDKAKQIQEQLNKLANAAIDSKTLAVQPKNITTQKSQTPIPIAKSTGLVDKRIFNKRDPASGRRPGGEALRRRSLKELVNDHFSEEVEVKILDKKTGKEVIVKKPRTVVMIEQLYQTALKNHDTAAMERWLNRALGKAVQPISGDDDEPPVRVDIGIEKILGSAYGDDDASE